jgi:hypothetical protein
VTDAAKEDTLKAALAEAKAYIDALTINSSANDPATVVGNFGKHFTWDNEKRENSKSYLFDWSYYNGVVFEGLEYVYEVTGEEVYKDYVIEAPLHKEGIEWAHNYTYNANDQESPRVLMIGDSICNGYQWKVRELLANRVNISFFITSYCITRERYLRMLDMILEDSRYDLVLFNSGHLANSIPLWEKSFRSAIRFIGDKLEGVKLALVKLRQILFKVRFGRIAEIIVESVAVILLG